MKKLILLIAILAVGCSKDEPLETVPLSELGTFMEKFEAAECIKPRTLSDMTWDLSKFTLYHTEGLERMALSGNTQLLGEEYCNVGMRDKGVIPELNSQDAIGNLPHEGYASIISLNGWLIAMYHPVYKDLRDNWIMYNEDGTWERWDLGWEEGTAPFLRKSGTNPNLTNGG